MPYVTTSLTSVSTTTTTPIALNWIGGKPTTVSVSAASSNASSPFYIQYTLDDLQRVSSGSVLWFGVSSNIGQPATTYQASASWPDGVTVSFLNPIAGIRILSTAISSGPLVLKVLQGEGW